MLKLNKKRDFRCKECGMHFDDAVRLERHFKAAHPPKHDGPGQNGTGRLDPFSVATLARTILNALFTLI